MAENAAKRVKSSPAQQPLRQLFEESGQQLSLRFSSSYGNRDLRLIEVPEEIIQIIKMGQELKIIGDKAGDAALCTNDRTFSIKKVETSNHGTRKL